MNVFCAVVWNTTLGTAGGAASASAGTSAADP